MAYVFISLFVILSFDPRKVKYAVPVETNMAMLPVIAIVPLVLLSIFISQVYYNKVNESVDPRVVDARHLYTKYNLYAENNQFESVMTLMDSIEMIFMQRHLQI